MADEILFGELIDGGKVNVTVVDNKMNLIYKAIEKAEAETVTEDAVE